MTNTIDWLSINYENKLYKLITDNYLFEVTCTYFNFSLKKSTVLFQANSAAALSYLAVVSL